MITKRMATAVATVTASEAYTARTTATATVATTIIATTKSLKFKILKYYRTKFSPKIQDK